MYLRPGDEHQALSLLLPGPQAAGGVECGAGEPRVFLSCSLHPLETSSSQILYIKAGMVMSSLSLVIFFALKSPLSGINYSHSSFLLIYVCIMYFPYV